MLKIDRNGSPIVVDDPYVGVNNIDDCIVRSTGGGNFSVLFSGVPNRIYYEIIGQNLSATGASLSPSGVQVKPVEGPPRGNGNYYVSPGGSTDFCSPSLLIHADGMKSAFYNDFSGNTLYETDLGFTRTDKILFTSENGVHGDAEIDVSPTTTVVAVSASDKDLNSHVYVKVGSQDFKLAPDVVQSGQTLLALGDGRFAMAGTYAAGVFDRIGFALFNADGTVAAQQAMVNNPDDRTSPEAFSAQLGLLGNGRILATWTTPGSLLQGRMIDSGGAFASGVFALDPEGDASQENRETIRLSDGSVLVTYATRPADSELYDPATARAVLFDPDGNRIGRSMEVGPEGIGLQTNAFTFWGLSAAALDDMRFVTVAMDQNGEHALAQVHKVTYDKTQLGAGNNDFIGGSTDDIVYGGPGNDVLKGGDGYDTLVGEDGRDSLLGGAGADWLNGGAGNDVLDGGAGMDDVFGGDGDDLLVDSEPKGADWYSGGSGFDTLRYDQAVSIRFFHGIGFDEDFNPVDRVDSVEQIVGSDSADAISVDEAIHVLSGRGGNDRLAAGEGADTLAGGAGADTMSGGTGDDVYYVDNVKDVVQELGNEGTDTVYTSVSYGLFSDIETLRATSPASTAALSLTGNDLANTLTGNAGANRLDGGSAADRMYGYGGDDVYLVDDADDVVVEAAGGGKDAVYASVSYTLRAGSDVEVLRALSRDQGSLSLTGNEIANAIFGTNADDTIDGRGGADQMYGYLGDDTYRVDNAADAVYEAGGGGTDTVYAKVDWAMAAGQEIEVLRANAGATPLRLTGNARANTLFGGSGADTLAGGGGADNLFGGVGDDTFVVGNAGVTVSENAKAGNDTVLSSVGFVLSGNVENLTLTGTAAINGSGNTGDNILAGNGAANRLAGGAGADVLIGGGGVDRLNGGAGADLFLFNTADESPATAARDTVEDFSTEDKLDFRSFGAGTTVAFQANSANTAGVFAITCGDQQASLTLSGSFAASGFSIGSDGHGGSMITYAAPAPQSTSFVAALV